MDKDSHRKKQKKPDSEPLLLTIKDVGALLQISESKIYTMLEDRCPGGIPIMRFGRCVRVSPTQLRRWLEQQ
jgi:excisionase family DNA binding protein